jgi:hypothetical protein
MLVPLVLALALHAEPNEAEKLFRDMERKVMNAKSIECVVEDKIDLQGNKTFNVKGSLAFAEGNRACLEISREMEGKVSHYAIISDGMKARVTVNDEVRDGQMASKEFCEVSRATFARGGMFGPFFFVAPGLPTKDSVAEVSDFKLLKKEKIDGHEAQVIQYNLRTSSPILIHLWIDTKTNLPLKRVHVVANPVTETYSKFSLDGKIDPKKFELPK